MPLRFRYDLLLVCNNKFICLYQVMIISCFLINAFEQTPIGLIRFQLASKYEMSGVNHLSRHGMHWLILWWYPHQTIELSLRDKLIVWSMPYAGHCSINSVLNEPCYSDIQLYVIIIAIILVHEQEPLTTKQQTWWRYAYKNPYAIVNIVNIPSMCLVIAWRTFCQLFMTFNILVNSSAVSQQAIICTFKTVLTHKLWRYFRGQYSATNVPR